MSSKREKHTAYTHDGHKLSIKEEKFIEEYLVSGNASEAVVKAGYQSKAPRVYGHELLTKPHIANEIAWRTEQMQSEKIADAQEILEYFTRVLRGEEKDSFGLDAPLSERTKAAQELAKRQIDIPNKANGDEQPQITINLNWGDDTNNDNK